MDAKEVGRRVEPGSRLKLIRSRRRMALTFQKSGMRIGEVPILPNYKHIAAWVKSTAGNIRKRHNHTAQLILTVLKSALT